MHDFYFPLNEKPSACSYLANNSSKDLVALGKLENVISSQTTIT